MSRRNRLYKFELSAVDYLLSTFNIEGIDDEFEDELELISPSFDFNVDVVRHYLALKLEELNDEYRDALKSALIKILTTPRFKFGEVIDGMGYFDIRDDPQSFFATIWKGLYDEPVPS